MGLHSWGFYYEKQKSTLDYLNIIRLRRHPVFIRC